MIYMAILITLISFHLINVTWSIALVVLSLISFTWITHRRVKNKKIKYERTAIILTTVILIGNILRLFIYLAFNFIVNVFLG